MGPDFFEFIVNQTGVAAFAAFALWIAYRVYLDGIRRERENAEIHRNDKARITDVLEKVTKSNTELCMLIREMLAAIRQEKPE